MLHHVQCLQDILFWRHASHSRGNFSIGCYDERCAFCESVINHGSASIGFSCLRVADIQLKRFSHLAFRIGRHRKFTRTEFRIGYPGDEDKARELFQKLDQAKTLEDFVTAATILQSLPEGNGKVGVVGFCYGGGVANTLAARLPTLNAAVPFYGRQPEIAQVPKIKAPLLIHYAEADERVNAGWPEYEKALKAAHVEYQAFIYPKTQHGFNNDTTPRYDAGAAQLAWSRTMAFFEQHLRG